MKLNYKVRLLMPSITDVVIAIIFIIALTPIGDFDVWWQLKTGEYITNTGSIPNHDIFSYTATTHSWIPHEWLSNVIFYNLYVIGDLNFIIVIKALIAAITMGLLYNLMTRRGANAFLALLLIIPIASVTSLAWSERPHIFTLLFLTIFIWVLQDFVEGKKNRLWLLPLLIIPWINLHGGFVIGLGLIFIYLIGESVKRYFGLGSTRIKYLGKIFLISIIAALINPNTYKGLLYPLEYIGDNIHKQFIVEWGSTNIRGLPMFEILLFVVVFSLVLSKKRKDVTDLLILFVFGDLSLTVVRHVPLFAIVVAPILGKHTPSAISRVYETIISKKSRFRWRAGVARIAGYLGSRSEWVLHLNSVFNIHLLLILFVVVVSAISLPGTGPIELGIQEGNYPVNATEFLKQVHIEGNMFNEYACGGYLIWELYPEYRVFIDGRADMYRGEIIWDYMDISNAAVGWESLLDTYDVDFLLIYSDGFLARFLSLDDDWQKVYEDPGYVIFKRAGL
jgi:hypothetical protein